MYYLIANKVGILIQDSYERKFGTFGMDVLAKPSSEEEFHSAASTLTVCYSKELSTEGCMNDDERYYSSRRFVDKNLGIQIDKESETSFVIYANQDCPEWFMCTLELTLLKAGVTFAHCAALEKDNEALFMPARGGVGKTATVVKMIEEHGWKLLGDDLVLLDEASGAVFPYHKQFVIYGYHKDLFPQLFQEGRGPVRNDSINHMMTRMIPTAKRMLRHVPGLLAFAREHNPQQIRVYPKNIFSPESLSSGAKRIFHTVWLERVATDDTTLVDCDADSIASRCAAITLSEMTYGAMNLNDCLFTMCGSGMINFQEVYNRIFEIVKSCISSSNPQILSIPKSIHINQVSEVVFEKVNAE